ncbi:MAG: thiamine pyrophosphate-dependent dehydrogenase E1 component subunit alpha [Chloroflexota bacterium]
MEQSQLLRAYELMLMARRLDDKCEECEKSGRRVPQFHSGTGQEATSVGAVLPLRVDDYLVYTHRGYGALLAKGVPPDTILKDMFLTGEGTNRGYGSVMHVNDPKVGIVGRSGVFGSRFGIATGLALASKLRAEGRVALCMYGEAAGARGPLYESLNLATIWKLPVVLVAENNGFSICTRTTELYAGGTMTDLWRGFPIPITHVDGNDVEAVFDAVSTAVDRARRGEGPSIVEAFTYRLAPHIPTDRHDGIYRSRDEVAGAWEHEPLGRLRKTLLESAAMTQEEEDALQRKTLAEIERAFASMDAANPPRPEEVNRYIYWQKEVAL